MKYFLSLFIVSSLLLTSCKKETESKPNSTITNIVPFTEVGRQMKNEASTANQQQQNTTIDPTTIAKGMNPAHGQPEHRCDIAVGAPLNSPAVAPQQNTTPPANTVTTATTPAEATPTVQGMNPPHGQTNHRCDIAVGAPLPK
ncbi:hypothetical protein [Flavobacterium sp. LB2P44]|uniref:hypothetical protein n=1 Tax=Flavobacterium sp. LB2P44 TaxID=3401713 RepID=UPI003AAA2397